MFQAEKKLLRNSGIVFGISFFQVWFFLFVIVFGSQPIICGGEWMPNPRVYAYATLCKQISLITVQVSSVGYSFANGHPVELETVVAQVRPELEKLPLDRRMVTVKGWGGLPYKKIIELVDELKRVGATTVDYQLDESIEEREKPSAMSRTVLRTDSRKQFG